MSNNCGSHPIHVHTQAVRTKQKNLLKSVTYLMIYLHFLESNKTNLLYMVVVSFKVCGIELEMLDVIGSR